MNTGNVSRIKLLNENNYDTWKLQMQVVLIKADLWKYINGTLPKPESDEYERIDIKSWKRNDQKARSEIILPISATESLITRSCHKSYTLKTIEITQNKMEVVMFI